MKKVAILTNIVPIYRKGFYDRVFKDTSYEVHVYCQSHIPGANYITINDHYPERIHTVKFISAKFERICWQFFPAYKIFKEFDVIILDGNPRILSHALFATLIGFTNKKLVIWSMVHSFNNNKFTEKLRLLWIKLFRNHFVYNDEDVNRLIDLGFKNKIIIGMNNGLDQEVIDRISENWKGEKLEKWKKENNIVSNNIIISSGRLFKGKFEILATALNDVKQAFQDILWICIGGGSGQESLKILVSKYNLEENVLFVGSKYEEEELAPYFLSSKVFVHPTAVGLSIMHAFGYGLPIITHNNFEEHGPEIIAFKNHDTGLAYQDKDPKDLANKICGLLHDNELLQNLSKNAINMVRDQYNTEVMYSRFKELLRAI